MNQAIKAQWIAALRSGNYAQTQGMLRSDTGFCCLGILCDLHSKAGLGTWIERSYDGNIDLLPDSVAEWAELEISPYVNDAPLVDLNDGVNGYEPRTFAQIADLIEEAL